LNEEPSESESLQITSDDEIEQHTSSSKRTYSDEDTTDTRPSQRLRMEQEETDQEEIVDVSYLYIEIRIGI
jgi:hypothetical protein